jgi:hypothetical protein
MSRFSNCLAAMAAVAVTALMPPPAQAGSGDGYVEGGYGLGWYGGRSARMAATAINIALMTTGPFPNAIATAATVIAKAAAAREGGAP